MPSKKASRKNSWRSAGTKHSANKVLTLSSPTQSVTTEPLGVSNHAASPHALRTPYKEKVRNQSAAVNNSNSTSAAVSHIVPAAPTTSCSPGKVYLKNLQNGPQNRRADFDGRSAIDPQMDGPINARCMALRATAREEVQRRVLLDKTVYTSVYHYNESFELSDVRSHLETANRPIESGSIEGKGSIVDKDMSGGDSMVIDEFPLIPDATNAPPKYNNQASEPTVGTRFSTRRKKNISPEAIPNAFAKPKKYTWDHEKLVSIPGGNDVILEKCPKTMDIDDPMKNLWGKVNKYRTKPVFNQELLTLQLADKALRIQGINPTERKTSKAVAKFLNINYREDKNDNNMETFEKYFEEGSEVDIENSIEEDIWDGITDDNRDEKESYRRFLQTGAGELTPRSDFDSQAVREILNRAGFINSPFYEEEDTESPLPPLPPKRIDSEARAKAIFKSRAFAQAMNSDDEVEASNTRKALQQLADSCTSSHIPGPEVNNMREILVFPPTPPVLGATVEYSSPSSQPPAREQLPTPPTLVSTPETEKLRGLVAETLDAQDSIGTKARRDCPSSKKRSLKSLSDSDKDDVPPPKKRMVTRFQIASGGEIDQDVNRRCLRRIRLYLNPLINPDTTRARPVPQGRMTRMGIWGNRLRGT